jgi:hypothetical protein
MTSTDVGIVFTTPASDARDARHHADAAKGNIDAAAAAISELSRLLDGADDRSKILLRAAAGAGKSYALRRMVKEALDHPYCSRVAVTAFANKQVFPLAGDLGKELGAERVCLFIADSRRPDVPQDVMDHVTVVSKTASIPLGASVIVGVSHKLGAWGERTRLLNALGPSTNGDLPFDVLMVDEAWQLALHRFATVEGLAPIVVGVGDVGQLPPIDPSENPWRGDPGYNPYRAWPTQYDQLESTCSIDLPAVWRPAAVQLPLWRSFYDDWDNLTCVAAPGDRSIRLPSLARPVADVWEAVATGQPVLLEVADLPEPEQADIDLPLLDALEDVLAPLVAAGFDILDRRYDGTGHPQDELIISSSDPTGDPLIDILATRNQAVDDATAMVERLREKYDLADGVLQASTVDSWQGQTNRITIAMHPLSGAARLDEFNSAFGRLAVTCTRATHGLLMVARAGLDDLLANVPPRPGTPFGEPGPRALPRQTHQRILAAFRRGTLSAAYPREWT